MFAASADAFFLQKPVCKTNNAHMITGSMFIKVQIRLINEHQSEDVKLRDLLSTDAGFHECLININEIETFFPDDNCTIAETLSGKQFIIKQSINEIHERINRAYSLPLLS